MHLPRLAAMASLLGLLSLTSACRGPQDGTEEGALEAGGRERSYLYHHPPGWTAERTYPLVISLHGRLGDGEGQERLTHMTDVADREGFIVAYPDGYRRSWHDAREQGPAADNGVDDIAFISALIDHFVAEHAVDPARVYVTGTSNGAIMSYRVACELSHKIAAAGPVIGLMPDTPSYECKPSRPVPMMIVVGTDDPLIPYEGGEVKGGGDRGRILSAHETRARWATFNGCEGADFQQTIDAVDDDTRVVEMRHTHCKDGAQVALFSVEGGGHTWPNGIQYLPEAVIGKTTKDVDASEELWSFFRGQRR